MSPPTKHSNQGSSARRALLDALLKEEGIGSEAHDKIPRREESRTVTLSFAQWRLWFVEQLIPGTPVYNIPTAIRLSGSLQVEALEHGLNEIIRRHENLRTTFSTEEGKPVGIVSHELRISVPVVDLRGFPVNEREQEALLRAIAEARKSFDLTLAPLLRATVWRLEEKEHLFLLMMHHITSEAWSIALLFRELESYYEAFVTGKPAPNLPDLPIQYGDYARWESAQFDNDVLKRQLSYWTKQLGGHLPTLQLPSMRQRPAIQGQNGAILRRQLPRDLTESLTALCKSEGASMFMILLAAYQTLLFRYTGQDDILVGSPISNRNRSELEALIGFFVSTIVFRTSFSGAPSFRELLRRVREVVLEGFAHQDMPFERLVDTLHPERDASHHPVFQVMFAMQNTPMPALNLKNLEPGKTLGHDQIHTGTSKLDMILVIEEQPQGLQVWLEYNSDLFDSATINRMLGDYQTLLQSILANPEQGVSDLPFLGDVERQQLLVDWNNTRTDLPGECCIHQVFESQVERTPDAVAVKYRDVCLTYAELNRRANNLASQLRQLGVATGVLVAMVLERSVEAIIAHLGILKAGGAYVPLDLAYPKERIVFMLEDTNAPVLITQSHLVDRLPVQQAHVLCMDSGWGGDSPDNTPNPDSGTHGDSLAYVIYTSGSTGRPKGVAVPHRAVLRLVINADYARFGPDRVFLQLAPISFDAATFEIWGALLHGACCVLFPDDGAPIPEELGAIIEQHGVTTLWLTSSLFNSIIDMSPKSLQGVEELLTGGEALSVAHIQKAQELLPHTQLINGYGPTESTTFTCCYRIPRKLNADLSSIPIGRPIANTQVYILDRHMQPVPVGVPGELHIGGIGLAQGYWNRPELTSEKFIPDPFNDSNGSCLYKTGDLVRYLPDGNIEFLGRIDQQVKIRGFRVELGEIEAVLLEHEAVAQCAVILIQEKSEEKRLAAYIVPENGRDATSTELRKHLRNKLPDYMIPQNFIELDALPMTPNGKLDRNAFPAPLNTGNQEDEYVAPRTEAEALLARIWQEVLGIDRISIHDNFFDLGGHSLLSIRVVARLKQETGIQLSPLLILFDTLEQVAAQCPVDMEPGQNPSRNESKPLAQQILMKIKGVLLRPFA